ncbi:MAG: hypothetical protein ACLUEK_07590 [Oscillospiraceae bacterium]
MANRKYKLGGEPGAQLAFHAAAEGRAQPAGAGDDDDGDLKQRRSQEALGNMAPPWAAGLGPFGSRLTPPDTPGAAARRRVILYCHGGYPAAGWAFPVLASKLRATGLDARLDYRLRPSTRTRRRGGRAGRLGPPDAPRLRRAGRGARGDPRAGTWRWCSA